MLKRLAYSADKSECFADILSSNTTLDSSTVSFKFELSLYCIICIFIFMLYCIIYKFVHGFAIISKLDSEKACGLVACAFVHRRTYHWCGHMSSQKLYNRCFTASCFKEFRKKFSVIPVLRNLVNRRILRIIDLLVFYLSLANSRISNQLWIC